jgi:hypothetical protein
MAYSTTYPEGQVSKLGQIELAQNRFPHVTYVGRDGTKFYLSGPLAPTPGAQNGVVMIGNPTGFMPPFQHLDNEGARQDGTTWFDALYDPAEIDFQVEVSGITTADTRAVIRSWLGAWDAKQRGRLHVFTPENGEWWARVRQLKTPTDQLTHTYETYGKQRFTWSARNDDAFWESFDSVDTFSMSLSSLTEKFQTVGTGIAGWTQTYSGSGAGTCDVTAAGVCSWTPSGNGTRTVINRAPTDSATDDQVITVQFKAPQLFDFKLDTFIDIWGRLDNAGNGIRARIGDAFIILSRFVGGVETVMSVLPTLVAPLWNEKFTLICGTSKGARNFKVQRDGFTIIDHTESGTNSLLGPLHRGRGFGMEAGPGITGSQVAPPPLQLFDTGDNNTVTQNGFLNLYNRGDQDGWPRYLCYGPGTFTFSDGPAPSDYKVTFGPLLENQIALVTTLPRLRGVTDLSPEAPAAQTVNQFQKIVEELISFATNNNVPPLLQQFESLFGILPPQGNMYSLLTGRFTTPIPAKVEGLPPKASPIACSIVGGNADSKIVAALTPLRRWPL